MLGLAMLAQVSAVVGAHQGEVALLQRRQSSML